MIGRHQTRLSGDNTMAVMVRVAGKSDVESILQADQPLHGIGRRRVHTDLPVPINRHKAEGRIDGFIYYGQLQAVALSDPAPIMNSGAAEWIHPETDPRAMNGFHIQHTIQVAYIGA